jgi:glyoxylase-like metal-dependent hydrolase (beta-lactamase superfamily II)
VDKPAIGGAQAPGFYRFKLGAFEAIALHEGVVVRDRPPGFVRNAGDEEVGEAFASAGMPRDKLTITFTALAVKTGQGIVLIDTGMGDNGPPGTGMLVANLGAAGIRPEDVGTVIISHFHGDHIGGLRRNDGSPVFARAQIMVPGVEWDYWMDEAKMGAAPDGLKGNFELVRRMFSSNAGEVRRYGWGEELLPGFRSVQASGHTPGMSAIEIASGDARMMFVADITNNPLLFVRNPGWQAIFDMNPDEAIETRRRLLDRAAAEKLRLFFFHAPFPGLGYVTQTGDRYEYLPALWTAE